MATENDRRRVEAQIADDRIADALADGLNLIQARITGGPVGDQFRTALEDMVRYEDGRIVAIDVEPRAANLALVEMVKWTPERWVSFGFRLEFVNSRTIKHRRIGTCPCHECLRIRSEQMSPRE